MIEYLFVDLDNTLYPKTSGLGRFMGDRMGDYVAQHLDLPPTKATEMRRDGLARHGTTLRWLVEEYALDDVEQFIDYVHPKDLNEFLTEKDRQTAQKVLREIGLPASVITNSPLEHAERVLDWLGLKNRFEHIFDLRFNGFAGKPDKAVYRRALDTVGHAAERTLFADDVLQYLLPFRDLGGYAVHIAAESAGEPGIITIGSIAELADIVEHLGSGK